MNGVWLFVVTFSAFIIIGWLALLVYYWRSNPIRSYRDSDSRSANVDHMATR